MTDNGDYRILVTGANGQLGHELVQALSAHGRLVPCVRTPPSERDPKNAIMLDVTDSQAVREVVRTVFPNLIVNAAAYTAVDEAESDQAMATAVNAAAPGVLAEEAARINATLVHYSTDYVFNGAGSAAWREEDRPEPLNVYGRTKLAGERAIETCGASHVILRTSWLYGIHGTNFVKKMLQLSDSPEPLRVVDDQFGSPTSARFVAEVTANIVARTKDNPQLLGAARNVIHAACAGETSWHGFATEIFRQAEQSGMPIKIPAVHPVSSAGFSAAAKRPTNSRLSTERLTNVWSVAVPDWRTELQRNLWNIYRQFAMETRTTSATAEGRRASLSS